MTIVDLRKLLDKIIDPSNNQTLASNNAIKHLAYNDEKKLVTLIVSINHNDPAFNKQLRREIAKVVKLTAGFQGLHLEIEQAKIFNQANKSNKPIFIGIISGKGGVGKSSVACNIAYRMMKRNLKVGIIDADIYGSSIPTILGMPHEAPVTDENSKIIPLSINNIEVISTEFFTNPSQPVIWRGAMLNNMLNHFFYDVKWQANTDYVIIDFPPGTGDIALDIKNIIPEAKMILVTSPHPSASHVAIKAGYAAITLGHEIIGIIENMAYYINPLNQKADYIFGEGGGRMIAEALHCPLIARIPLGQPKNHSELFEIEETNGKIYDEIVDFILVQK